MTRPRRAIHAVHWGRVNADWLAIGVPPLAVLRTSDGHSVFWLQLPEASADEFLTTVADGRRIIETALGWKELLPKGGL